MFSLKNKVIVINGASSGIGKQCSIVCSKMGATVILFGRDEEKLKNVYKMLEGKHHHYFIQNIEETEQLELSINKVVNEIGPIDGFIHCAGIQKSLPLRSHNKDVYINQFNINVIAGFEISRILTKKANFNKSGGSLVFISSIRGILGAEGQIGYSASKGAVIAGVRSMALELAKRNIRVNSISPGMVEDTEMTKKYISQVPLEQIEKSKLEYPLGWVSADDIANTCIFLLSDQAKKITGSNIVVDGGFSAR